MCICIYILKCQTYIDTDIKNKFNFRAESKIKYQSVATEYNIC